MKFSVGDRVIDHSSIWTPKEIITIQGIIGEAYVVISNHGGGRARVLCEWEMQDCTLITDETIVDGKAMQEIFSKTMDMFKGDENEIND